MIDNLDRAQARLVAARRDLPAAVPVLDALLEHPERFVLEGDGAGLEFTPRRDVLGRPNRAVIKLFRIGDGPFAGRVALFFYKRSQVPFSRDRHSYGAALVPEKDPDPAEVRSWLEFAARGFDPEARPPRLRLAITFTVPD